MVPEAGSTSADGVNRTSERTPDPASTATGADGANGGEPLTSGPAQSGPVPQLDRLGSDLGVEHCGASIIPKPLQERQSHVRVGHLDLVLHVCEVGPQNFSVNEGGERCADALEDLLPLLSRGLLVLHVQHNHLTGVAQISNALVEVGPVLDQLLQAVSLASSAVDPAGKHLIALANPNEDDIVSPAPRC